MERLEERLRSIYGERRWIIAFGAAAGAENLHDTLTKWDCETIVVAATDGVGGLPDTQIILTGARGDTIVDGIRAFFDSVENPSSEVMRAIDVFDAQRTARVIAEPYATATSMVGRSTFGVRRPEWSAWEDKMRVDALWESLGIPHAPYRIVEVGGAPDAAGELASELGTVWVADNTQGWHGGGDYVRWVRSADWYSHHVEWFAKRANRVRVMPFLDGLPCSIHGWVTNTGVAVFQPVEILILRRSDGTGFGYAGVSTTWTASERVTTEMRAVAAAVGAELARTASYIGPFGVDGILTVDGFRPTELNPRMSAGAGVQLRHADLPLDLVMRAEIEGLLRIDHSWLEETVLSNRNPSLHFGKPILRGIANTGLIGWRNDELVEVPDGSASVGRLTLGTSTNGMYLRAEINAEALAVGEPAGPFVAEAINLASSQWDLGLPEYVAAPNLVK